MPQFEVPAFLKLKPRIERVKSFEQQIKDRIATIGEEKARGHGEARSVVEALFNTTGGNVKKVTDEMIRSAFEKLTPDKETLTNLSADLVHTADTAYDERTTVGQTEVMAQTIEREASKAFAHVHQRDPNYDGIHIEKLQNIFYDAAKEAGSAYNELDALQLSEADLKAKYTAAHSVAHKVNQAHLEDIATLVSPELSGGKLKESMEALNFRDVIAIVSRQLGISVPPERTATEIQDLLTQEGVVDQNDYFRGEIANLPISDPGAYEALTPKEAVAVELAIRLANVTWKAGQVHRAVWEEKKDRIDPLKREVFDVFDVLKSKQFERIKSDFGPEVAVYRVAYELWKDVLEVKGH